MSVVAGLKSFSPRVGHVGESPRHDQPGGDPLGAVAHLHVDRDEFFVGQGPLGLLQQFVFGRPKRESMLFPVNLAARDIGSESA